MKKIIDIGKFSIFSLILGSMFSVLFLGGCELLEGKKDKPPLKGKRLAVVDPIELETGLGKQLSSSIPRLPDSVINFGWNQPEKNAAHDIGHLNLPKQLRQKWSIDFSKPFYYGRISSTPIFFNSLIFALGKDNCVYAINLEGKKMWSTCIAPTYKKDGNNVRGGVCGSNNKLYVTNAHGELYALDIKGKILWKRMLSAPAHNAPVIARGYICVLNVNNQLEVFSEEKGTLLWKHSGIMEDTNLLGTSVPAISEDVVVVAYSSGEVVALALDNGEVLWSELGSKLRNTDCASHLSHIKAAPIIHDNIVYTLSYNGQFSAFDLRNGELRWSKPIGGVHTPVISGDLCFLVSTDNRLICLNPKTGAVYWTKTLPSLKNYLLPWSGPILAGGYLYLSGKNGKLLVLDAVQNGKFIKYYDIFDERINLPPIVAQNKLFILTEEGRLVLFSW